MIYYRPSDERGTANFGWLLAKHSFSFGHYYDPKHMGVSALRVINEDRVSPGAGFDTHGHRDMEIITYVLEGAIAHKDSMGNEYVVPAGEIQRMSAGTGVTHSEYNHSDSEALRLLQIWIVPDQKGIEPGYEQKAVEQHGTLTPLVTADGRDGSLMMHQDAAIHRLQLAEGESFTFNTEQRPGYLHVIEGQAVATTAEGNFDLSDGDAIAGFHEVMQLRSNSDVFSALWFDLPTQLTRQ